MGWVRTVTGGRGRRGGRTTGRGGGSGSTDSGFSRGVTMPTRVAGTSGTPGAPVRRGHGGARVDRRTVWSRVCAGRRLVSDGTSVPTGTPTGNHTRESQRLHGDSVVGVDNASTPILLCPRADGPPDTNEGRTGGREGSVKDACPDPSPLCPRPGVEGSR